MISLPTRNGVMAMLVALALLSPTANAQLPDPAASFTPNLNLEQREACLAHYRYGSVTFAIEGSDEPVTLAPGDDLTINGTATNTNQYPLPEGRVITRILRHDEAVAADNWHPVVAEVAADNIEIPAGGSAPFAVKWQVPARAPAGTYRAEFYYLAGQRYAMAGLPYVANASGGSMLFAVTDGGAGSAITFDRNQILLLGQPLKLRSVPPEVSPQAPVTVSVPLRADSPEPLPVTLHQALYEWSDTDLEPPVLESQETVLVTPGQPLPVEFTWPNPVPGVYELVLTATPQQPHVLPSIVKVRFPVTGTVPRIIYSGLGNNASDGGAQIVTCTINGTFGASGGSVTTRVVANGQEIAAETLPTNDELTTLTIPVAASQLSGGDVEITTEARDQNGVVTDSHSVTYGADLLAATLVTSDNDGEVKVRSAMSKYLLLGLFGGVVIILLGSAVWRGRSKKTLPPPTVP